MSHHDVFISYSHKDKSYADALNLGRDILRLDAYQADQVAAYGATKNATTGELRLTGNMAFFFDVPTDYDPAQGTVTVSGKPVALPAE